MRLFFSVGEASGDAYAAALLAAIGPTSSVEAVGGRRLRALGAKMIADSSNWGSMGIIQALKQVPRVSRGYFAAKRALATGKPGVFVPVDYGYLNIRLARWAKAHGWYVIYFIPPGSWRKDKQGIDLPTITDEIITPFPWSAEMLSKMGANAHFFGHPLKQMILESPHRADERIANRLAVLPGSRMHEILYNLPTIAQTIAKLDLEPEFAIALNVDLAEFKRLWVKVATAAGISERPWSATPGDTYGVLSRAQVGLICSGTATLEAALCNCPSVVMYRVSKAMEMEFRILRPKYDFISLPNILLGRRVVEEYIQMFASPERLSIEILRLVQDPVAREAQLSAFRELEEVLGNSDGVTQSALRIKEALQKVS